MRDRAQVAEPVRIRVIIFEAQELYRTGLGLLISKQTGFEMAGYASTWADLLALVHREKPSILLLALSPTDIPMLELLPGILAGSEETKVLALLDSNDPEISKKAVRLGAAGVLTKDKPSSVLIKAIECIAAGEAWLDRSSTATLLRELANKAKTPRQSPEQMKIASLSEREKEVIKIVGKGLKNKQVAEALFISSITVHHHLTSIYSKLEVTDRLELLIFAYRHGLAEIPR